jgi:hypothetical protein
MRKEPETEWKILLQILKGTAHEGISPGDYDTGRLIQLAGIHRLSYPLLVFSQSHPGWFSPAQKEALSLGCRDNALLSLAQLRELIRVAQNFFRTGIPFVVIKGPQLAHMIYGREALKESVDLDIMLVHGADIGKAHLLLSGTGFTKSNLDAHPGKLSRKIFLIAKREVHYVNPGTGIHIDLHVRAGANTYFTKNRFRHFFDTLETYDLEGQPVNILPPEQYLVYLCYHGSLHQFSRLAWLMDIRAYIHVKRDILNYQKVISLARDLKAERSLFLTMTLLNHLFGDEIPGVILQDMTQKGRIRFLASRCIRMLSRDSSYGLSLQGRFNKLVYIMILIRGFAGRIDWLYGIVMRILAARI